MTVKTASLIRIQMSNCCPSSNRDDNDPKPHRCPVNGREGLEVSTKTIAHHITEAWSWRQTANRYFFCDDPACDVVYFGDDGSTILRSQMRTRPGQKDRSEDALLCHCFGVSKRDFLANPDTRKYVVAQTKAGQCSCLSSNPSGRCCLKDFPRPAPEEAGEDDIG